MSDERLELDEYERWIESEIGEGNFVVLENLEKWKKSLKEAAHRSLGETKKQKLRLTVEMSSSDLRDEVIKLLKDKFGGRLKVTVEE